MNYLYWIGMLMFIVAGGILHDVPFLRFVSALSLISWGTVFVILGRGA